jgi:hypothetical protein
MLLLDRLQDFLASGVRCSTSAVDVVRWQFSLRRVSVHPVDRFEHGGAMLFATRR